MAREIPVYRGGEIVKTAIVDGVDWLRLSQFRWQWNPRLRAVKRTKQVGRKKVNVTLHREVAGCAPGDGTTVRHVNGDTLDNRRENLRVVRRAGAGTSRACEEG